MTTAKMDAAGKIMIDKEGCVFWTWDPEGIKDLEKRGLILK